MLSVQRGWLSSATPNAILTEGGRQRADADGGGTPLVPPAAGEGDGPGARTGGVAALGVGLLAVAAARVAMASGFTTSTLLAGRAGDNAATLSVRADGCRVLKDAV
ncbi:hypothetical protein EON66_02750, partial [archaeon]